MTVLTANEALQVLLHGVKGPAEIRDPEGNLLGHYTPAPSSSQRDRQAQIRELFDLQEAERVAATQRHGSTTEEVLRRLQSLEPRP